MRGWEVLGGVKGGGERKGRRKRRKRAGEDNQEERGTGDSEPALPTAQIKHPGKLWFPFSLMELSWWVEGLSVNQSSAQTAVHACAVSSHWWEGRHHFVSLRGSGCSLAPALPVCLQGAEEEAVSGTQQAVVTCSSQLSCLPQYSGFRLSVPTPQPVSRHPLSPASTQPLPLPI